MGKRVGFWRRMWSAATAAGPKVHPTPHGGGTTYIALGHLDDTDPNPEVRGERWYGTVDQVGIAGQMIRDPYVRSTLKLLHNPLLAAIWDFKPADDSALAKEVADFCRWNFFERLNFQTILREVLYYHRDGVSVHELTSNIEAIPAARFPLHSGLGSGVVYTGWHFRPAASIARWHPNPNAPQQLLSIEQYLQGGDANPDKRGFVSIPASVLLRFTYEQEGSLFTGFPLLRSAYGAWKTKRLYQTLSAVMFERHGVGMPVMTLPENVSDTEMAQADEMLAALRAHEKGFLTLPAGYTFTWNTAQGTQALATAIADAINTCNRDIATNVLAGYMQLGSTATGSYALAESQSQPAQVNADVEAAFICNTFYYGSEGWSPLKRLVELNYGAGAPVPRLTARNLPTRDWTKITPEIYKLASLDLLRPDKPLRDFLREVLTLPPEDLETQEIVFKQNEQEEVPDEVN